MCTLPYIFVASFCNPWDFDVKSHFSAVSKSTLAARREAAAEIIQRAKSEVKRERVALFQQFAVLIHLMIKLFFYPDQPKAKFVTIQTEFSALKHMMPVGVIMSLQKALP